MVDDYALYQVEIGLILAKFRCADQGIIVFDFGIHRRPVNFELN
jgi:hypothetical protein